MTVGGHHATPDDPVARALERASGILPDQGPIGVFVHHNTLHAFQHLPFHQGVQEGAAALGARPYLSLAEFREALTAGRIDDQDVRTEVGLHLGLRADEVVAPGLTRASLWHTLMVTHGDTRDVGGIRFAVAAGIAHELRDPALWHACLARAGRGPALGPPDARTVRRHRDVLRALGADDPDPPVHGELIRLCSGFLDQGHAHAALPGRERGFLRAVAALYAAGAAAPRECRGVEEAMGAVHQAGTSAAAVIRASLDALGVHGADIEPFLLATALALPGWTGMFSRLERHPEDHPGGPPVSLVDFVAVRLLFDQYALARECRRTGVPLSWPELRSTLPAPTPRAVELDAVLLWHLARAAGWSAGDVASLSDDTLAAVWRASVDAGELARRSVFLNAYERTYRRTILDALAARRALPQTPDVGGPRAQFVFCIDEREESIRRAVEEQHPGYLTYGVAGFFGVAIDYLGLYDHEPAAHCPVVVTPGHEVHEQPVYTDLGWHAIRQRARDRWHALERRSSSTSRTLAGGAGMSFLLGPIAAGRTLARVLAPRSAMQVSERIKARFAPRPRTRLSTRRVETVPAPRPKPLGFSLQESVDRVTSVLTNIGLQTGLAPVVVMLGHGSTSLNNPHESAHDCGACGGRRGGANARLFADMANRPDVRDGVRQRGIDIPEHTWFIGALHDTASDAVVYYDLESVPAWATDAAAEAMQVLEQARCDSAAERCRRFDDVPLGVSPQAALQHVEARSAHLAQPRPEYGHCTNAICIVGRRALTRGLHFDRRAFLVSYDPTNDVSDQVLERILAAVGPVGAGISLEYYFSAVDNEVFGCGTKLPHNVTGLIGVMSGHQSDLRTGLPKQMVELHEPMRLLLIVDATPEALLGVASRQAEVAKLVVNEWVQLVSVHPVTGEMAVFERGAFVPYAPQPTLLPVVDRSADWHGRTRAFVSPALVRRALPESVVGAAYRDGSPSPAGAHA